MIYDLKDCSIVIPFSLDSRERLEHVYFLYEYWNRYFYNHQVIFVEHGKEPVCPFASFLKEETEFSLARVSNHGASLVKHPFFCKCDADALLHPKAIFDAFEMLKKNSEVSFVIPYNGFSFDVRDPLRRHFLDSFDPNHLPLIESGALSSASLSLKNSNSTGLIHLFRTDTFLQLGGYNEEFIGWGYEDEEIVARFRKMGFETRQLDGYTGFHFHHPRKMGDSIQVFKNYYRFLYVANLPPEEVPDYIKSWTRLSQNL